MEKTIKYGISALTLFILCFTGRNLYYYYFDCTPPVITIKGIAPEQWYSGNVVLTIEGRDEYKVQYYTIFVDNKPMLAQQYVQKKSFSHLFDLPVFKLAQGKHTMKIVMVDSAKKENSAEKTLSFFVDNEPLDVRIMEKESKNIVSQGNTLHIILQGNKPFLTGIAKTLSSTVPLIAESEGGRIYECFIPISADELPNEYIAEITVEDAVGNTALHEFAFRVTPSLFKQQSIAIGNKKNSEGAEINFSNTDDFDTVLRQYQSPYREEKLWSGNFYVPCTTKKISSDFGTMRHSQERGRYRHNGIDFAAMPRSAVWASQSGVVAIKDTFVVTGKTVGIDHGGGIMTLYGHLDDFADIQVGDRIKKGALVGKVGMSGYASGFHLHFGIMINGVWVNPVEWLYEDMQWVK